jgi:hypothetical protein
MKESLNSYGPKIIYLHVCAKTDGKKQTVFLITVLPVKHHKYGQHSTAQHKISIS